MLSLFSNELARRSPWTCLSCSTLTRASQALITAPSNRSSVRIHQRKNSSSKTSSPPKDEPRAITTPAEAPSKETKPVAVKEGPAEKRPSTRISRRRSKDVLQEAASKKNDESQLNLPSVPSTQHLHPIGILSSLPQPPVTQLTSIPSRYSCSILLLDPPPHLRHNRHSSLLQSLSLLLPLRPQALKIQNSRCNLHSLLRRLRP